MKWKYSRPLPSRRAVLVSLTIGISVLNGIFALQLWNRTTQMGLGGWSTQTKVELSCEEIHQLGVWGFGKYGGQEKLEMDSEAFARSVGVQLAEKLDPFRLLLTREDVDKLSQSMVEGWGEFIEANQCASLMASVEELSSTLESRFLGRFLSKTYPREFSDSPGKNWVEPEPFDDFAADSNALKKRIEEFSVELVSRATPSLRQAYRNNQRIFLRKTYEQLLFTDRPSAPLLLAKAFLGAMDPFSTYFSEQEYEVFSEDLSGGSAGIGVKIRQVPQGYMIQGVVEGSPAGISGEIREGDIITSVDGNSIVDLNDGQKIRNLFRGSVGEPVELGMLRGEKTWVVHIVRNLYQFSDSKITSEIVPKDNGRKVGVIKVPSFYGVTESGAMSNSSAEDLRTTLKEMLAKTSLDGLVLDLRGNPGGYLEEAVSMAGMFIGPEPVVAVLNQDSERVLRGEDIQPLYDGPLVVLVDEESASASEVLAGALRDHQRAILVGSKRTYGKGSVQKLFHLDDDFVGMKLSGMPGKGVVKVTTSLFYSPLGYSPSKKGVPTHFALEQEGAKETQPKAKEVVQEVPARQFVGASDLSRLMALSEEMSLRVQKLRAQSLMRSHKPHAEGKEEDISHEQLIEATNVAIDWASMGDVRKEITHAD